MKQPKFTKFLTAYKPLLRAFLVCLLVVSFAFIDGGSAWAARSGGRMGGGSFSRPSISRPSMGRSYSPRTAPVYPGGGYGGGFGGGFGFPFLLPFFGFGGMGGGLFSLLIVIAVANFLISSFRRAGAEKEELTSYENLANPPVTVNALSIGLLAGARELQADLNKIAKSANTATPAGLTLLLQETTLALLRHPEYWVYASSETQQTKLNAAESQFNRLVLAERSKVAKETLTNVHQEIKETALTSGTSNGSGALATTPDTGMGEYIVVTLVTASEGKLELPKLNSDAELRQALNLFGAVPSDKLMAVEVLWQPQAEGDTLSASELLTQFPTLKRI
jgi:uncharacterized membrane protein